MRKTSHDGLDSTSITSGLENETKKSGTTGLIKIKKSSIKRKVPNFGNESDDGIVEPLLQSDREKTETATRSAKYLLTKAKTDSISEHEDSIKMSDINLSSSAPTPTTATNKMCTSNNSNNIMDSNFISNINEMAPIHNQMNTNVFGGSDISKAIISTKSPVLVELDVGKTSGYNPSLIFTTAKIHSDCKTKLIEPGQSTTVSIISTVEKRSGISVSLPDTENKKYDISGKHSDVVNIISEKLNKNDKQLSNDQKLTSATNIRNNSTSKNVLNLTEVTTPSQKSLNGMPKNSLSKSLVENNETKKYDTKSANFTTSFSNAKHISKDGKTETILQAKTSPILPESFKSNGNKAIEKSSSVDKSFPDNTIKSDKDQPINDKSDKKITVQGSKKLQRQKKATVEESQENTSGTNIIKDKLPDAKKISYVAPTKPSTHTAATPTSSLVMVTTSSSSIQATSSNNNKLKSIPQPVIGSKIPSPVVIQKGIDCKTQPSNSKISTPTIPTSNTMKNSLLPISSNRTTQGTEVINPTTLSKNQEKQDSANIIKSPLPIKPDKKEIAPTTIEKVPPAPKTPPYIVSTSKTKIGVPIVTSSTLKSDPMKTTTDSNNVPNTKYFVKTTPSTRDITVPSTSSSFGTKQSVPVKQTKSKSDKHNEDK